MDNWLPKVLQPWYEGGRAVASELPFPSAHSDWGCLTWSLSKMCTQPPLVLRCVTWQLDTSESVFHVCETVTVFLILHSEWLWLRDSTTEDTGNKWRNFRRNAGKKSSSFHPKKYYISKSERMPCKMCEKFFIHVYKIFLKTWDKELEA